MQHKGYNIYWTGYKEAQNNDMLIGQWVAYGPTRKGPYHYACTTGTGGEYERGAYFDIQLLNEHDIITARSSESDKERVRRKTYEHLLRLL